MIYLNVIIDSREKKYDHVTDYFDKHDIKWYRSKLIVADYQNPENPMIVVDRKQNLQEVAGNVCQQHERFVRELTLANELGYRLIVLIEEPNIKLLKEVPTWYNWRLRKNPKAINGKRLYKIMSTMSEKYGVEWQFTTKENCGKRIVEILGGGA